MGDERRVECWGCECGVPLAADGMHEEDGGPPWDTAGIDSGPLVYAYPCTKIHPAEPAKEGA